MQLANMQHVLIFISISVYLDLHVCMYVPVNIISMLVQYMLKCNRVLASHTPLEIEYDIIQQ